MKKEEKQQKFGFFFGFLTDCKNRVKQIMQHVKNNSKKPHGKEKQARAFCLGLGIDYDKLTPEEFVTLIGILEKSKNLKSVYNQRGKASPHQKGRKRRK